MKQSTEWTWITIFGLSFSACLGATWLTAIVVERVKSLTNGKELK